MKNFEKKIIKNFRDSIAISNLKEELIMKKVVKKQIVLIAMISIVFLTGGFATVNAATGGALAENIKGLIFKDAQSKIENTTKIKEDTFEVEDYEQDENGNITSSTYTFEGENGYTYKIYDVKD